MKYVNRWVVWTNGGRKPEEDGGAEMGIQMALLSDSALATF